MNEVLSVRNINKSYGSQLALNNVTFSVPKGSVFGILGPNGSGKTTLLGIVMDVLHASSGDFLWNGHHGTNKMLRQQIGTLLETPNFYSYLSAEKNLKIAAAIKGQNGNDISRVLKTVSLFERKNSKFSSYSLGMKQRLAIASSLIGNPSVLVFDEPTNGLDPEGIAEIRELITELNSQGKTIIMASHILDEVEKVCTHVAILQKGTLKSYGTVQEVLSGSSEPDTSIIIETLADDLISLEKILLQMPGVEGITQANNLLDVKCSNIITTAQINTYCFEKEITLTHLRLRRKNLETRFLEITGNQTGL